MSWIQKQLKKDEGFTLIELMVVVLIIAILIAIAIPTFLGARERAQDRATQSELRNALTAAKTIYTDNETYAGIDGAALKEVEPSLVFQGTGTPAAGAPAANNPGVIGVTVDVAEPQQISLNAFSVNGKQFCITDIAISGDAGTWTGSSEDGTCPAGTGDTSW